MDLGESWTLTRELSPREVVRVADVDGAGDVANDYSRQWSLTDAPPASTWAMYLADPVAGYHFVGFDLDAKAPHSPAAVAEDLAALRRHLAEVGIAHVVCESGPTGGRHVWVALAEAAPAELVADLAIAAHLELPTLDYGMLRNPATGCLRPPGAPHRAGGVSRVIAGDLETLRHATTTVAQLVDLAGRLGSDAVDTPPAPSHRGGALPVDEDGLPYLPGPRRALPARSAAALHMPLPEDADASAVQWTVLLGAAAARWRWADVAAHLDTAPGLEHSRTHTRAIGRPRANRPRRGSASPTDVLRRDWARALEHVANAPRRIGTDETFDARAATIANHVDQVQLRAAAARGRWTTGGGPADRRVLDVLCMLALEGMTVDLEADTRRLGLLAGIGRETARIALLRLAEDGWIVRSAEASGPHGARWSIDPQKRLSTGPGDAWAQAVTRAPRPALAGAKARTHLLTLLRARNQARAHDLFTARSPALGLHAGNVYAHLTAQAPRSHEASDERSTWESPDADRRALMQLEAHGLVEHDAEGWHPRALERRTIAADLLGVTGRLEARARNYELERELWAWWSAEHERIRTPGRHRAGPRGQGVFALVGVDELRPWQLWPAYPRRRDRRADHYLARDAIATGRVTRSSAAPSTVTRPASRAA